jgi:hypothetical protein
LRLTTRFLLLSDGCGLVVVGALSDGRMGLLFKIASGFRQRSHSRVQELTIQLQCSVPKMFTIWTSKAIVITVNKCRMYILVYEYITNFMVPSLS